MQQTCRALKTKYCNANHKWSVNVFISPGNHRTSPRSSTSLEQGSVMLRNRAVRGGGRQCVSPTIDLKAEAEAGPLTRTTATPQLPWPDDNAKMVSASTSPSWTPSQVDRRRRRQRLLLQIRDGLGLLIWIIRQVRTCHYISSQTKKGNKGSLTVTVLGKC